MTVLPLLGKILETDGARIINVSSEAHRFGKNFDLSNINFTREKTGNGLFEIYGASKLCNVLFTRELSHKIRALGQSSSNKAVKSALDNSVINVHLRQKCNSEFAASWSSPDGIFPFHQSLA